MASYVSDQTLQKIRQLPEYIALTQARKKIIWPLTGAVIVAYFTLILAIAFRPADLGNPLGGGTTSIGVVLGLGVIILCLIITGIYVAYANRVLEPLARQLHTRIGAQS